MSVIETYEFVGREVPSPLIVAAGAINGTSPGAIVSKAELLSQTGVGGQVVGSFTVPPKIGNEAEHGPPTSYFDRQTGEMYNAEGLPNVGMDAAVELAPRLGRLAHAAGQIMIYSASPMDSPEHGDSVEQACLLVATFLQIEEIDFVELNVSCPNVVTEGGGRKPILGYDLETMQRLFDALEREVGKDQRLGIKLPPYMSDKEKAAVPGIARLLKTRHMFQYAAAANTISGQVARDQDGQPILSVPGETEATRGAGGMSGPATKEVGRQQLQLWNNHLWESMDIVSTLGVDSGEEVAWRLGHGAAMAGGVSFLWNSRDWGRAVSDMLDQYAQHAS